MPALSEKQQQLMAMALHSPSKIYKKNRGVLGMSQSQLRDFAETGREELPLRVKAKSGYA